jgi:hypothetical protein
LQPVYQVAQPAEKATPSNQAVSQQQAKYRYCVMHSRPVYQRTSSMLRRQW